MHERANHLAVDIRVTVVIASAVIVLVGMMGPGSEDRGIRAIDVVAIPRK